MSRYLRDAIERVVATFVVAFLGSIGVCLAQGAVPSEAAITSAVIAGAAAAVDVLKVILAKYVGDPTSAGF